MLLEPIYRKQYQASNAALSICRVTFKACVSLHTHTSWNYFSLWVHY